MSEGCINKPDRFGLVAADGAELGDWATTHGAPIIPAPIPLTLWTNHRREMLLGDFEPKFVALFRSAMSRSVE
jgi:hypothetical protein